MNRYFLASQHLKSCAHYSSFPDALSSSISLPVLYTCSTLFHLENTNAWVQMLLSFDPVFFHSLPSFLKGQSASVTHCFPLIWLFIAYSCLRPFSLLKVRSDLFAAKSTGHFPLWNISSQYLTHCTVYPNFSCGFLAVSSHVLLQWTS